MIMATYAVRGKTMAKVNEMKLYNNMRTEGLADSAGLRGGHRFMFIHGQQQYTHLARGTPTQCVCATRKVHFAKLEYSTEQQHQAPLSIYICSGPTGDIVST